MNIKFDAFFAHNSSDKKIVRQIKRNVEQLARDRDSNINLKIWLDEDQIVSGLLLPQIQTGISECRCAVFFIGSNGSGQWQGNLELPIITDLAIRSQIKLIPVLLPGVQEMPNDNNYLFLRAYLWIAFSRTDDRKSLSKLLNCIMGSSVPDNDPPALDPPKKRIIQIILESKYISVIGLVTSVVVFMVWIIIYGTSTTSPPRPVQTTYPSDPALRIVYYARGDKESVEYALTRLGPEWTFDQGIPAQNLARASSTNAIWFGSNVSLKDVKLVAEKLLEEGVPIKVIRPFIKPSSILSKSWFIDIGADHDCPNDKRVLTLREIRNAKDFLYQECGSWEPKL
jgi:hypothetical protein